MNNEFILDIIARLNKQLSKSAINGDLKSLNNTMYVRVLAKLSKTLASKELKKQLKELDNLNINVGLNAKIDKKAEANIKQTIQGLQKSISDLEIGLKTSKVDTGIDKISKSVQRKISKTPLNFNLEIKKEKAIADIEYIAKKYSKLFSNLSAAQKYEKILNSAYGISDTKDLSNVRAQISAFTSELKSNGLATQSVGDKWKTLIDRSKELFSAASVIRILFTQMKEAVHTTIDLDKVYTDLVKVNDQLERNDYSNYLEKCNRKAQDLAATQKALIEGAAEFSKSGYDLSTSDKLTEKSTILSNVGEMEASDSAKAIISGVQAYDTIDGYTDVADKAQALIDKYNELGNVSSITTAELAQGVQSVGSVFADANTSVDEFLALLSAGNRQYQNADSLALGLRTSALRIRGCTAELEEMGEETDNVVTSAAKLEEKIKGLTNINGSGGVDILEADKETFRSIYDIYVDIGKVYQDMSDVDQSALLELIAGKNRASAISATLNNMTEAETILQNSLHAAGSAQREYDAYLESTEAHIQQFQAKLVETYSTFMNGDMISHVADLGTGILDLVNKADLLKHSLIAIATIKIGQGITTVGGAIAGTVTQMSTLGNALEKVKNLPMDKVLRKEALIQIGQETNNLTDKNLKLLLSQKQLEKSDTIRILRSRNLTKEQAKEKLETLGLTNATNTNTAANTANAASNTANAASVKTLKGAFLGLKTSIQEVWAAMSMLQKASIVFAAASTLWSIGSSFISSYKQHQEEIRQATEEAAQAYKESSSSLDDYVSRYQELRKALIAAKGDEEETLAVKRQLLDLQTEINDKFGATCGTIDLVTDSYRDMTQAIKDYNKELANTYLNENEKGIHDAEKQMTKKRHYNLSYSGMVATTDKGKALKEIAEKYKDKGIDLLNEGDGGVTFSVHLNTDAESAYSVINDFETDLRNKAVELGDEHLFDDVLEISSNSLNNAKSVIDDYGEKFKYSLIAKIASDDNKATVYNDALKAVEEYNNAVLESEDPYSDKKVASARQNLEEIKQSIQGNTEEWGQYSSVMDDVFDQADTRLIDFNDKLQNDDSLKKYAGELKGLDTLDLQSFDQNAGKNNAFDKLKESAGSCGVSVDELIDRLVKMGIVQDEIAEEAQNIPKPFSQRFQDLWDSESFKDAREELQKLSKEAGITEDDLYSLARENEELSLLLDESGISAQFAAACFNQVCNGADGFSAITEDALALDQVLHGMDESLQSAAASKSAYDKAMEQDDYDSEFKNYQDAYKSAMEMFENGDYGKHFRSAMEYLLGDKSYTMSIEEMKNAMDGLKNVFGEDATNGLEFLDKLYEKKDVLDGLDSSLEKLSDGSYKFDLKPDEFEAIGEAIGMTTDEVAACTNALGMFGDFRSYDMEELEETLNGISIAAKDGEKSILSLQGVESILSDRGYNGYEIYHILEDIKGMGSLELLDFNASDSEGLQTVIDKLSELDMLKINGDSIDVSGLADKLKNTFGMTFEDIQTFLASLGESFDFTDYIGIDVIDAYSNIQEKIKSIQAEIASGSYSTDEIVQMQTQLEELKRRADALREPVDIKLTSNIEQTKAKLEEVTRKYNELKTSIASKQEQGITVTYGDTNALNELANQKAALEEQLNHYNELKVTVEMEREQADADIKDLTSDKETKLTVNIANKGEVDAQFNQWTQPKSTTLKVNVTANDPNGLLKGGTPTSGQAGNSGNSSSSSPASGTGKALGNAQIGHSFADGTIGAPKTETALINELGNETIIDPESGTYEIVKGGAQFRKIKKGQIILNHLQTQALQKYGKISSFGKMLFGGNAKLKGSSYASGEAGATNPGTKKPYNNNGSSRKPSSSNNSSDSASRAVQKAADTAKEATEEIFDWIERRIKKFQAAFDKWIKQAETAVTSGFINKYYKKATSAIKNELSTYGKAYKRYMKQADSVGLSKKYRDKVKNGTIDIQSIKDEKLAEQIKKYQEYYDKAQESTTSFVETAEKMYNLPLDKAATKIEKFSDAIDLLDKKLDNAVGAKSKNKLIDKQTKEEKKTLDAYKEANKATKKDLKSAKKELSKSKNLNADDGITKKEKKKIKDAIKAGKEVDLSYFKVGSAGYNAAVKYNEALKANTQSTYDLKSAQEDYKSWLSESSTQKFENIQTDYEHKLHEFEQRAQEIDNKISLNEEKGYLASSVYYDKLLANEQQNNAKLMEERDKLVKSLNDSVSSGNLKEYSDDWYDLKEKIDSVTNAVDESTISIQNFMNTMREIKWDRFDKIQNRVSELLEDVKFAVNELSRTELVSSKAGGLTDNGKSAAALRVSDYETYRVQAADYLRQIYDINNEIADNPYDTKLIDRKRELVKAYQDCISGAEEEKYAVIDLYKQAYDALLDKIRELISEYEELLDAEKSAYDYQQSIAEKTKDIADIRKQLAAYSGDMSEETRAKIQKLEVDLKEAEKSLQEAQYEKYISDTKDMFDDLEDALSDEINDIILALADNFNRLIDNINAYSNDAMANVKDYLAKIGFDTSSSISNIGTLISNSLNAGTDISRATYTTVDEIKSILEKMQQYVDSIANGGNASSGADSTATSQPIASAEEQKRQALAGDMAALQSQLESLYRQKTDTEDQYNKDIEKAKASSSKYKDKAKEEKNSKKKKEYEAKKKEYDAQAKSLEKEKKNEIGSISKDIAKLEQELKLLDALLNSKINPATPKYAKGSKNIPFEQWAVTQEKGRELICTADGQMLTPLGKGDKVFTKEMSDNLWGLSQTSLEELENIWNKKLTYGGLNHRGVHSPMLAS